MISILQFCPELSHKKKCTSDFQNIVACKVCIMMNYRMVPQVNPVNKYFKFEFNMVTCRIQCTYLQLRDYCMIAINTSHYLPAIEQYTCYMQKGRVILWPGVFQPSPFYSQEYKLAQPNFYTISNNPSLNNSGYTLAVVQYGL